MAQAPILIVDDDPDVSQALRSALVGVESKISCINSPDEIPGHVAQQETSVVLLDLNFRRGATRSEEGLQWIRRIRDIDAEVAVIVITAHADIAVAVAAMKEGATDFLTKPWSNERVHTTVKNAIQLSLAKRRAKRLQQQASELALPPVHDEYALLGASPAIHHVLSLIERSAPTDANVLILGENGTGKELVARAIHRASRRAQAAMISVDLGAVSPTLFESELFGHVKGAFTDARADRVGRIAAADGGTLFLDEIGNLPLAQQPKLLSAIEQRRVTPLGSNKALAVDARIVSATNLSRDQLADVREFRADLLFRLNTVEIHVPPLRQRREDIALLAEHFLRLYEIKYAKPPRALTSSARDALTEYDWPGNVRALRHAAERAVILSEQDEFVVEDFALPRPTATSVASDLAKPHVPSPSADDLNLDRMEQRLIERALSLHAWNISLAARELGLTRASLYRRMERYGL